MRQYGACIRRITVTACLCLLAYGSLLRAQNDSVVNERIPVRAEQLEAHWQVNCAEIPQRIEAAPSNPTDLSPLFDDLEKCMHIYNTPGTAHYRAEPDYRALLQGLQSQSP